MSYPIPEQCPSCEGKLYVRELKCQSCQTRIIGDFYLDEIFQLNYEQQQFLKVFIKTRGNIKNMEKELEMSYPTVRNKLNELIKSLGYKDELLEEDKEEKRKDILDMLESGEIEVSTAAEKLKEL
ncbi:DUF2089 domain-containing protein [Halanaerobium sp. Z-7514]|uniref:DUF2089 domain-containing protein n=1 Tax=Halanaerobium polyolivorans TaxID=2886943 RepID=A0AAW4WTY4_9FIRM|nr:DUF2089 domain-containing protein [Halanaerobium polyolivorans]MCC3144552.1 DUF2089 domain-containing protein [Halanaerobium polyolivorans]